ncbi:spermidine/putrescine transport system permease protein [Thermostichus sp. MS-CIW-21]|uniref:ABC transporter permease n=1 Tax=unclassified Synechococcus TaxID=2626047 RepID=UPI0002E2DCFD|nr:MULTISPECIES: ABC transporter permease [unclassified Synechococcus]PIK91984.1 putrescine/spermidine ABC transporter permease [Synechococcus sp. 65AY6Li]PIK95697.1 putrescine/spermidine ABC transporter permease [Synechococcus sp. 60AY4M2]PIL01338.1 putrescine/spermidine ABC transporter permease [Synechococcus sp. 65AY640]
MAKIPIWLRGVSYAIYGFLYLPILLIAVYSFNRARFGLVWTGFTFDWYWALFRNAAIWQATQNTLVLAGVSTLVSTLLGSLLGYGLYRYRFPGQKAVQGLLLLPVVVPDIVMAITLLLFYQLVRAYTGWFELGLGTMVIAHITFQIAFVAIVVRSRLQLLDPALEEAAYDLYANTWQKLRYVTLPLAMPGILAAALLAFTLSIDDFVISFFTSGPESQTLPILIYSTARRGVTPEINALSTVIVAITLVAVMGFPLLSRSSRERGRG